MSLQSLRRFAPLAAAAATPLVLYNAQAETDFKRRSADVKSAIKRRDAPTAPTSAMRRNIVTDEHKRDDLLEWIKKMLHHSFVLAMPDTYMETWQIFEDLVDEHRELAGTGKISKIKELVPTVGTFYTPLPVTKAWQLYDAKYCASKRNYITPTFNEVRHTLNLAQCLAVAEELRVISFDGDQTLYSDGQNFSCDELAAQLIALLRDGVTVAVMTAAGYQWDGPKYEHRLAGLLKHFEGNLTPEEMARFYVVGGECNYMLRCNAQARLERVPDQLLRPLKCTQPLLWERSEIDRLLDIAEATIKDTVQELRLRGKIIRKERAVGLIPGGEAGKAAHPQGHGSLKLKYEVLDEVAMRCQGAIEAADPPVALPYCAFNGGRDAWIDVGNKGIGMEQMQALLNAPPDRSLHVGDQFLKTGNDVAARSVAPTIWITSPGETTKILEHILKFRGVQVQKLASVASDKYVSTMNVYTGGAK